MAVRQALSSLDDALLQDGFYCILPGEGTESEPGWVCEHYKYCKVDCEIWIAIVRRLGQEVPGIFREANSKEYYNNASEI